MQLKERRNLYFTTPPPRCDSITPFEEGFAVPHQNASEMFDFIRSSGIKTALRHNLPGC